MALHLAVSVARGFQDQGGSSAVSVSNEETINTLRAGESFGEYPAPRPVDPMAYYRCFRDRWPDFIRRNFRNSTDAACFFGVDDRTVRGWLEGSTAPRGQVVAYAVVAMPSRIKQIVGDAE